MKTNKIAFAFGTILVTCACLFALDPWGGYNAYTIRGVAPQNWGGNANGKNVVVVTVTTNWVTNHSPYTSNVGYIDMDAVSGKNIYAQILLAQTLGRTINVLIDPNSSSYGYATSRITGVQAVAP